MKTETKEMLTLTALKERGWTDKTIRDLLGEPDELKANPRYRSAAPMKLYELERVEKAETEPAFVEAASKRAERSARGKQVAERRREALVQEADGWEIRFFRVPASWSALKKAAIEAKQDWYYFTEQENYIDVKSLDGNTTRRWCENYLRHECSNYEELISIGRGQPGVYEVYDSVIRPKVDKMVSEIINDLKNKPPKN